MKLIPFSRTYFAYLQVFVGLFLKDLGDCKNMHGPPYLCSTRQWLDEGWIVGGYSPDIVLICMAFIYRICMQYPHFTNAYDLSTRHLSIPVLYPPVTCACPPYIYDRHLYLQFIQRMSAVIYNTRSACFIHVIF